ncbi:MAG: class IV adenylate cyclase [Acidobacteriota bacterium]|nr:class IV adenylate cyclase [Acidobacteriota bacterium]
MNSHIEREIKLRYLSHHKARLAVDQLEGTPLHHRRLQDDYLLDLPSGELTHRDCTLRVRIEKPDNTDKSTSSRATVTFKGPPLPDIMKVREELETTIDNGEIFLRILLKAGWNVSFQYQKYREEFQKDDVVIAIDETPVGAFVELEGNELTITRLASTLGRTTDDYIIASYRQLYVEHCNNTNKPIENMVFNS